jgi:hypothetical protein
MAAGFQGFPLLPGLLGPRPRIRTSGRGSPLRQESLSGVLGGTNNQRIAVNIAKLPELLRSTGGLRDGSQSNLAREQTRKHKPYTVRSKTIPVLSCPHCDTCANADSRRLVSRGARRLLCRARRPAARLRLFRGRAGPALGRQVAHQG